MAIVKIDSAPSCLRIFFWGVFDRPPCHVPAVLVMEAGLLVMNRTRHHHQNGRALRSVDSFL